MHARKPSPSVTSSAASVAPSIPPPGVARLTDLPAEWQHYFRTLHVSAHQLVMRLSALEQAGIISADAVNAYAEWVERMARSLALVPIQDS